MPKGDLKLYYVNTRAFGRSGGSFDATAFAWNGKKRKMTEEKSTIKYIALVLTVSAFCV